MPRSASLLKAVRQTHLYVGVFVAPALLFFASTGAVQTFSLHETTKGSSYKPPRILVVLAQIHKKQTPVVPNRAPLPTTPGKPPRTTDTSGASTAAPKTADSPAANPAPPSTSQPQHNPLPLKIFFLLASISLIVSISSGLYMSYKYTRNKIAITALLVLGIVIPLIMIVI